MEDPRIDIVRRAERAHMFVAAGVETEHSEEHWRCRCGASYRGTGAIEKGHRHGAEQVLAALDYKAAMA